MADDETVFKQLHVSKLTSEIFYWGYWRTISRHFYRTHPKEGEGNSFSLFVSSHPRGRVPPARDGVPPGQGWKGYPLARDGVPPARDRTADGVLDMRWAICLLRSRRRTFLFKIVIGFLILSLILHDSQLDTWLTAVITEKGICKERDTNKSSQKGWPLDGVMNYCIKKSMI